MARAVNAEFEFSNGNEDLTVFCAKLHHLLPRILKNRRTPKLNENKQMDNRWTRLSIYNPNINLFRPNHSYILQIESIRVWTRNFKSKLHELQFTIHKSKSIMTLYMKQTTQSIRQFGKPWHSSFWNTWSAALFLVIFALNLMKQMKHRLVEVGCKA